MARGNRSPAPGHPGSPGASALQMVLDLFGLAPPPVPPVPPTEPAPAPPAGDAGAPPRAGGPLPIEQAQAPVHHLHPRASRNIWLGGQHVAYAFVRAQRRSIGFLVDAQGLTVRAPRWALIADVERALHDKSDWILRKLGEARQRRAVQQAARIDWADGVELPYLGQPLAVRLGPGPLAAPVAIFRLGRDRIGVRLQEGRAPGEGATLWVGLPAGASAGDLSGLVAAWLQHQARALFEQRLAVYAAPLGVRWSRLALTNARTRWGSATSSGHIRLNWRLLHFRLPVIDYVVAHELSHLRVMDHSPRFWQTVESVMPDYAALRAELKRAALPAWD